MAGYEKFHICDVVIDNESSGDKGLNVSVHVDTLGKCSIEFGSSMTIRTGECGIDDLREVLYEASRQLALMGIANREGRVFGTSDREPDPVPTKLVNPVTSEPKASHTGKIFWEGGADVEINESLTVDAPATTLEDRLMKGTASELQSIDMWNPDDPANW